MAIKRFAINGYGQVELNNAAFRRDGRIEAQSAIGNGFKDDIVENGMIVAIDNSTRTIAPCKTDSDMYGLVYSAEINYDQRDFGLNKFAIKKEANGEYVYPRIGYLSVGDKYTTNCFAFDPSNFTEGTGSDEEKLLAAVRKKGRADLYAGTTSSGSAVPVLTATKPTAGYALKVVKATTMPDGSDALQFIVVKA